MMKKSMFLFRSLKSDSYSGFKKNMLEIAETLLNTDRLNSLKVVLTEQAPPAISIIPFRKHKIAVFSMEYVGERNWDTLLGLNGFVASFGVTQALPVAYSKTWNDGNRTPGICLLTLFKQKPGISYESFIDRWHNSHTPLSLKLHPLWHYNRNVVDERAAENTENWDGIVEEHCRTRAELLNPFKFFGRPARIIPNMIAVYRDTKSFLDYKTIEPYLAAEYILKSGGTN